MMANARVNVLCKMTAGGLGGRSHPPNRKTWTKIRIQYAPSTATLIWQCDVINVMRSTEMGMTKMYETQ